MSENPSPTPKNIPWLGLAALLVAALGVGVAVWAEMTLTPEGPGVEVDFEMIGAEIEEGVEQGRPGWRTALRIGAEFAEDAREPPPPPPTALGMEQEGWCVVARAIGGLAILTGLIGLARGETWRMGTSTLGLAAIAILWPTSGLWIGLLLIVTLCPWIFEVLGLIGSVLELISAP